MHGRVVIGIDASTTAVKRSPSRATAHELFQAREAYPLSNPLPGHFEQDAEHWWSALLGALKQVADDGRRIARRGASPSPTSARLSR